MLFLLLPLLSLAQEGVRVVLDTNQMTIGDHNKLSMLWQEDDRLEDIKVDYIEWDTLKQVELLEEVPLIHRQEQDSHYYKKEIRFTSFDSGQIKLPPIKINWVKDGETRQAQTPPFEIVVTYPNIDTSGLAPIKPIEKEPLKWEDIDGYVYTFLGILLLAALIYFWISSRQKEEELPEATRHVDPHERAFIKLQALENKELLEKEEYEEFQVELTHIVREFLSGKYRVPALESTSRELIDKLKGTKFPNKKLPVLRELLTMADLVKFAKAEHPGDFHKRMLLEAREIVKMTNDIRR
jgi:hypothetical protein